MMRLLHIDSDWHKQLFDRINRILRIIAQQTVTERIMTVATVPILLILSKLSCASRSHAMRTAGFGGRFALTLGESLG